MNYIFCLPILRSKAEAMKRSGYTPGSCIRSRQRLNVMGRTQKSRSNLRAAKQNVIARIFLATKQCNQIVRTQNTADRRFARANENLGTTEQETITGNAVVLTKQADAKDIRFYFHFARTLLRERRQVTCLLCLNRKTSAAKLEPARPGSIYTS
jgi:hypothetical protein